jgi:hypothetical protein
VCKPKQHDAIAVRIIGIVPQVLGDRMTLGEPTMYVESAFADFLGRSYKLGHDDRLLVKLLPSTTPQSEIRVMTGSR